MKTVAIVLAAGSGKRMNSDTKKQYLMIGDKPVLYYSIKAFEDSFIDEIILVTSADDIDFCKKEIIEKYRFKKVVSIVPGGKERYNSVMNGLTACDSCDYVFIHDGARPFINEDILNRAYKTLKQTNAAVVGMPVKDTIKIVDEHNKVVDTPNRDTVWLIQTPQCFAYGPIFNAYEELIINETNLTENGVKVTDDAMVLETFGTIPVTLVEGSYDNIKITTPDDLIHAEAILNRYCI